MATSEPDPEPLRCTNCRQELASPYIEEVWLDGYGYQVPTKRVWCTTTCRDITVTVQDGGSRRFSLSDREA